MFTASLDGRYQVTHIQYDYDPLNRLVSADYIGDIFASYDYTYDAVGNMTAYVETVGAETSSVNRTFNEANQLVTSTDTELGTSSFTYDDNGNLVEFREPLHPIPSIVYFYNQRNLLVKVEEPVDHAPNRPIADYVYDGDGNRLQQVDYTDTTPVTTTYTNDIIGLSQVLVSDDGTTTTYNLFGLDLISQDDGTQTRFLLTDGLGSTRIEMVGTTIKTATTYEPYGKLLAQTGSSGTTYGFTGEQYDAATGLVYLRARYYNPSLKLFMSRDPFPGIPTMPASQHGYSYSHNNPVNLTDPTGESPVPAIIVVGGAVIVVVVLYIAIDTIFDAAPAMSELAGSFWDWCTTTFAPPRPQAQPQTVPQTKTETVVVPVPEPQTHPTPRPTLPPPGPDAPTPTPENNSWVYFVHGTSTATWVGNYETPRALGGGDFGRGFYVFEDTNWGRNSARSWAIIKSDSGGTPIVLRYKMKRETYDSLYTYQVPDYELTSFIRQYSRQGLTGYDLVIGGVGMRANIGLPGDRVRNFGFPDQYKFEGDAVGYLIFDGVVAK